MLPLLHGPMGEDGTVQGMLELANVAYVGAGVLGSALAMDKAMAKQVLAAIGIPQARHRAFAEHHDARAAGPARRRARPAVLRQARQHGLVGRRHQGQDVEALRDAIELALTYDEWVVVEEAIVGREIEVAVLGNDDPEASGAGEIIPGDEFYGYDDKYVNDAPSCSSRPRCQPRRPRGARAGRAGVPALRCEGSPGSTSSSRRTAAGSSATRSTRCPASRRSRCSPRCDASGMTIPRSSTSWSSWRSTATPSPPEHEALTPAE